MVSRVACSMQIHEHMTEDKRQSSAQLLFRAVRFIMLSIEVYNFNYSGLKNSFSLVNDVI
jgi:hypothetical protein